MVYSQYSEKNDLKICSKCNLTKSLNEFSRSKASSDGFSPWCKDCYLAYIREYREKNKRRKIIEIAHTTKLCPKCGKSKSIKDFFKSKSTKDGFQTLCKSCIKLHQENIKKFNSEKKGLSKLKTKKCSQCNEEKPVHQFSIRMDQKVGYSPYCKECSKKYYKPYSDDKREYLRIYRNSRRAKDPMFKLNSNFSRMIRNSLINGKSGRSWEKVVGYTLLKLVEHLEKQFLPSMSWNNYGAWHIDHIIPISYFKFSTTEDPDFKKCWSLKNLRPLWAEDNMKKGDRIEDKSHFDRILGDDILE